MENERPVGSGERKKRRMAPLERVLLGRGMPSFLGDAQLSMCMLAVGSKTSSQDFLMDFIRAGVISGGLGAANIYLESRRSLPNGQVMPRKFVGIKDEKRGVTHYTAFRSFDDKKAAPAGFSVIDGPCLFGGNTAMAALSDGTTVQLTDPDANLSENGRRVGRLIISEGFSEYECDCTMRLGAFVASLANTSEKIRTIVINVPKVEYYLYHADSYNSGALNTEQMLEWFGEVDKRSNRVKIELRRRMDSVLSRTGIEFDTIEPLATLEEPIRRRVASGEKLLLDDLLRDLAAIPPQGRFARQLAAVTREILTKSVAETKLERLGSLPRLSYVMAEGAVAAYDAERGFGTLAVENPDEERILVRTKQLLRSPNLAGIYPHTMVLDELASQHRGDKFHPYFSSEVATPEQIELMESCYGLRRG